jgi:hypothetical protein
MGRANCLHREATHPATKPTLGLTFGWQVWRVSDTEWVIVYQIFYGATAADGQLRADITG